MTSVYSITRTNPQRVQAAAPNTLNFQARLLSSTGSLVPDGTYNVEFKLYNASTSSGSSQGSCTGDANCLWTETRTGGSKIQVKNGYLSAYLGDVSALPTNIWNQQIWLTMNIGGTGSPSWDGEMTPRIRLTSVPYAFRATVAESAETLSKNTGSFTGTVDFSTLTADRTFLFPDTSLATTGSPGTICVYNGAASNCPAASGSAYYIQNDTVVQTQTNFNIQARDSSTNGTVAGVFRGAANGQTVDLVQFQATNGSVLGAITATGNLQVASSVDTRAAGTLSLGNSTATAVSIGGVSIPTTINGALTVTGAGTFSSTLGVTGLTTLSGGLVVTNAGNVAFQKGTDFNTTGSSNDVNFGTGVLFRLTGASAQTITGIAGGADGRLITLVNAGSATAIISNNSGSSLAANRITTGTGGDLSIPVGASIDLIYDSTASLWRVTGGSAIDGGAANQQLSNLSGTVAINQSLTPGADNTIDLGSSAFSWRTLYIDTSVLTPSIDTSAAGTLSIGNINATTIDVGSTAVVRTINIGTGAANQTINIGTNPTGSQVVSIGSNTNSSYLLLQAGSNGALMDIDGAFAIDINGVYSVGNQVGNNYFTIDSATGAADFSTYAQLRAYGTASLFDQGITLGSAGATSYTTPNGFSLTTRINIPNYTVTGFNSIIAFGLPAASSANARGILVADARTVAHQPTIGVLSPDESTILGFSWEGSNSVGYLKTLTGDIGIRSGTTDIAQFGTSLINLNASTEVLGSVTVKTTASPSSDDRIILSVTPGGASGFNGTITSADLTAARTWTLPDESGTICTNATSGACAGLYIQNQNAGAQATSNYWISGSGRADTSFLTPSLDNTTAAVLNIGTTTASGLSLSKNGATTTINGALTVTQLATFNGGISAASDFTVTPAGNIAFQRNTNNYTATGTQDNVNFGTGALFRITSASSVTINGITGGTDGRVMTLMNASANVVTLGNSASATPANHIVTGTGGALQIPAGAAVDLAYDSSSSVWRVIGGTSTAGGAANQQLSNLSGTVAVNASLTPGTDNTLDLGSSAFSWRSLYADTSVLTPSVDTVTASTLGIGTVTANAISISRTGVTATVNGALTVTEATTINGGISVASNLTVTQAGNVAFQRNTTDITATGTLTDVNIGTGALFRFNGATAQTLSSIANPADGRIITIINAAATALVIQNDTGGTAANRIITGTGASISVPTGASMTLAYDSSASRWRVIGAVAPTNGYIQLQSATPGTAQTGNFNISGTGIAATSLLTPVIDASAAGSLSIGTTTATSILMGSNATTTISVGQSTATNTVNVGNGNLTTGTQTVNIGTGVSGTGVSTISIGSTNAGSASTIRGGTGGISLTTNGGTNATTGTIIQSATNNSTGAFQVQNAAGSNLLQIDTTNNNITLLGNNSGEPQTWQTATPLSTGAQARDNTNAVTYNGYLYIPAGDNGSTLQTSVAAIKIKADGSLDTTWTTTGASVPSRTYTTVAQSNGYIYIMGGASNLANTNVQSDVYYAKINTDGTVGAFATTSAMPAGRKEGTSVVLNGYIYYLGGNSSATATPTAVSTVYYAKINPDGTLGAWATSSNGLPAARFSARATVANGFIYVLGGNSAPSSASSSVYYVKPSNTGNISTPFTNETTNVIPASRSAGAAYVANGYLYYAGGESGGINQANVYYTSLASNGGVVAWSTAANSLPAIRSTFSHISANGYLYAVGGWNGSASQTTAYYSSLTRLRVGGALDLVGLSGEYLTDGRNGGELTAGNTRIVGTLDVQDMANFLNTVTIQRDLSVYGSVVFENATNSTTAYQFQNAAGSTILNIDTTNSRVGIGTTAPSYDLSFGGDVARSIRMENRTTNAAGNNLTIAAGGAGSGASAFTGGTLTLQGGSAGGTGNANGGGVIITGGAGTGTGVQGLVRLDPAAFYASSTVTLNATNNLNTLLTNATNIYSTVPVNATGTGYTLTVDLPTVTTIGRILYISAVGGSNDFTLALAGTSVNISMKANSTATLIYNGTGWTAAGASSSTDLQAAYNNTLSSAGGAEIVLNASGGAADGLTIRNNQSTPIIGGLLEVQTSIGSNLLSVNNFAQEYAVNGGGETATNFATNWSGTPTSGTVTRTTTAGQYTTGLAGVSTTTTAAANSGARNVLSGSLTASTQYSVSFTAKVSTGSMSTLEVVYSRDGTNTSTTTCNTAQSLNSTTWSKITCLFTTPASGITTANAIFIRQTDAAVRTWYVDNLSVTLNTATSTPANVQIGGGINGGQPTLFTLDQFSAAPVANGNSTYYGSMYYDTTTGRIQCYEADGWGACGSPPDNIIVLTPEYSGAVLNGTGVGTMTADFCANQSGITFQVNSSFCASGNSRQYYKWTSPQASQQTYSIYVSYKLPTTYKSFASDSTITLTALTDNTTNGSVTYEVFRSTGSAITRCNNGTNETQVTSTVNTWQTVGINGNETSCGFTGGDNVIFKINVKAQSNASVYVENLNFTYYNN